MLQYLATDKKQIIMCMLLHGETFDTSRFFVHFSHLLRTTMKEMATIGNRNPILVMSQLWAQFQQ
jgi:hypothetical protein